MTDTDEFLNVVGTETQDSQYQRRLMSIDPISLMLSLQFSGWLCTVMQQTYEHDATQYELAWNALAGKVKESGWDELRVDRLVDLEWRYKRLTDKCSIEVWG